MAKKICLYGIFTALCIVLSFVESLIPFDFIAPGIKLGLANSVCLLLVVKGDIKGAFLVNIVRILLSVLLFSAPSTLIYSLPAGVLSVAAMALLTRFKVFGIMGFSVLGAVVHNSVQLTVALILLGKGVIFYSPFLLISAVISGNLIAILGRTLLAKGK